MELVIKNIKSAEVFIHILEERLKIINMEIERLDNILDKYGDYKNKKLKITTLNNKFNNLLYDQSNIKKDLKEHRIYKLILLKQYDYYNDIITIEDDEIYD